MMLRNALMLALVVAVGTVRASDHVGPDYGGVPAACKKDDSSTTYDNARGGMTVRWTDRLNKTHVVVVPSTGTVTVQFPIPTGGSWIWFQEANPQQQRTGFNANVTWVEAVYWKAGDHVRIQATGFFAPGVGPDPGLLGAIKDRVTDVKAIVEAGARTVEEALRIAQAAGMAKGC
jgi:hypothetical protein